MRPGRWAALAVALAACTGNPAPGNTPTVRGSPGPVSPRFERVVCSLPPEHVLRVVNGYHPERSGEIQIVPVEGNYFGNWSHSGPWSFLQRIPMLFYGPGHVPAAGEVARPATMADLAPTLGRLVDYVFSPPDGTAIEEAVLPGQEPPRVVVTLVWDGGGLDVLEEHPDAWPTLRSLIPAGVWLERATVGSSPSVTPAIHTTLGTGAFPRRHGVMDLRFDLHGTLVSARQNGPYNVQAPALADLYDRDNGNRPLVGMIGSSGVLGMIGSGAFVEGGDRDLAVAQKNGTWGLSEVHAPHFTFPSYFEEIGGLEEALRRLDLEDGLQDRMWMGEPFPEELSYLPAYADYQTNIVREVIRREGFGADDVPDLLFVNYKQIDKAGHRWSMNSPQMAEEVRAHDRALAEIVDILDREVGRGAWALALTSDHGSMPDVSVTGGFVIDVGELGADLQEAFDTDGDDVPAIASVRVTQVWIDQEELAQNGATLDDVARFLMDYRQGDNAADPSGLSPRERETPIFEAAFPGAALSEDLPCLPE
jgi:hypothetical protein